MFCMRARLLAPAIAVVGFIITLGFALWHDRSAHAPDAAAVPAPVTQSLASPAPPPAQSSPQPPPPPEPAAIPPGPVSGTDAAADPGAAPSAYGEDSDRERQARIARRRDDR